MATSKTPEYEPPVFAAYLEDKLRYYNKIHTEYLQLYYLGPKPQKCGILYKIFMLQTVCMACYTKSVVWASKMRLSCGWSLGNQLSPKF